MKKQLLMALSTVLCCATCIAGNSGFPTGKTPEKKIAFLRKLISEEPTYPFSKRTEKFFLSAFRDPSDDVREFAVYNFRGSNQLPLLIKFMATDRSYTVRQSAALSISVMLTSNGVETCSNSKVVEKRLDEFLYGLRDDSTAQFVVEVLGERYSGEKPMPCCFDPKNRARVVTALKRLVEKPPEYTIGSVWSAQFPMDALKKISECSL